MCVIAGYTGAKRAAPILVDMIKKMEYFDGGYATGIATIHEGKLYYAKAKGDVDMLLKMTDALDLPGTTGLIHSRPGFDFFNTTFPYVDDAGEYALMGNGMVRATNTEEFYAEMRTVMDELFDRGIVAPNRKDDLFGMGYSKLAYTKDGKPFYPPYSVHVLSVGDKVKDTPPEKMKSEVAAAVKETHERIPTDNITLTMHARLPDTITVCPITRPMSVLEADGECYLASCAISFPEDIKGKITHLPPCSLSQVTSQGLEILYDKLNGIRSEWVTEDMINTFIKALEEQTRDKALSIYELELPNVWHEPLVDCDRFKVEGEMLKPHMQVMYQALYRLYKEGRLTFYTGIVYARDVSWPKVDCYFTKFRVK